MPVESLRELCRRAEREVGRERLGAVMREHGVTKVALVEGTPAEAALRAAVAALLAGA